MTLLFAGGMGVVTFTLLSAARAIVLPRAERVVINTLIFWVMRRLFYLLSQRASTYAARDRMMALIAPVGLLVLPVVWLSLVSAGYTLAYYALGVRGWLRAYEVSGNALLTLGSPHNPTLPVQLLVVSEAALGLLLVALLVTYLPTIYTAFTKREAVVAQLELRAGLPPTAANLVLWLHQHDGLSPSATWTTDVWRNWEQWFMQIEESHTTLPVLTLFRSRVPGRSWVTAAATVLDATVLVIVAVDCPRDVYRDLCLKAGVITLNRVARFFDAAAGEVQAPLPADRPTESLHAAVDFDRAAFQAAYEQLAAAGIPLKLPEAVAWVSFNELRVRYQEPLHCLAHLAMAPF